MTTYTRDGDPRPAATVRLRDRLHLVGRWLATPPGTPVHLDPARPATTDGAAPESPAVSAGSSPSSVWTCASCYRPDAHPAHESTAGEEQYLLDGLPIDPLAFDENPDAFLRAVLGPTYGEAS